jgi:capsular exopolysaccharide synthesis family protein
MAQPTSATAWARIRVQLIRYVLLLKKRWWVPLLTISLGLCGAAWLVMQQPPAFVSGGRLMVRGQVRIAESAAYSEELSNFFGNQLEMMQSGEVLKRAHARVHSLRPELPPENVSPKAAKVLNASMFTMTVLGPSAPYVQAYVDAWMDEFMAMKKEMRAAGVENTTTAVAEELVRQEREMKQHEEEMHNFQKENSIGFLQEGGNSAASYLASLNRKLAELKTEYDLLDLLSLDQNLDRQAGGVAPADGTTGRPDSLPTSYGPIGEYLKIRQQVQQLKADRENLSKLLREKHPTMVQFDEQIAKGEAILDTLREESQRSLKTKRDSIRIQIDNLQGVIKEWEGKALDLARKIAEFDKIKSKIERTKATHDRLQASLRTMDVSKNLEQDTVAIMERASPAQSIRPGMEKMLLQGFLIGFLVGMGILFILDKLDDRISSFYEFRERFPETLLGQVPREKFSGDSMALLSPDDDRHGLLESFRTLRSSIIFLPVEGARPKTLLVTSATPSEGKTTVASNLAITLAFSGARVLLVDADLRLGRLHKSFGISADVGFSDVMRQKLNWREAVVSCSTPNLSILPRGKTLSHPSEHFLSKVTDQFLQEVYAEYDYVVFDSPPVMAADDVLSLAPKMDGAIFVVRFSTSSGRRSRTALDLLTQRQANVIGLVCNDVKLSETEYGYGSYYQYSGYHYRETEDSEAKEGAKSGV